MRDRKRTCVTIEKCLLCKTELFGYEIHANRAITFSIRHRCTDWFFADFIVSCLVCFLRFLVL